MSSISAYVLSSAARNTADDICSTSSSSSSANVQIWPGGPGIQIFLNGIRFALQWPAKTVNE